MNSRCGESINKNLGLNEFIADDYDDYISKARLLQNKKKLSNIRTTLRKKVLDSVLFDTVKFTKDLSVILKNLIKKY